MEEIRSVEEIALNNPIILSQILKQTSAPLKSARLVSHFWNTIVLSVPNTKLALQLRHDYQFQNTEDDLIKFFELCFTLDGRLARHIFASEIHSRSPPLYSFATKLIHTCVKFSETVQILDVSIPHESSLSTVYQVLQNCCPNLKQVRISCTFSSILSLNSDSVIMPKKPNLTLFAVTSKMGTPHVTKFVEGVIAAAPKLRGVTLPWGIYPDFANSKFLTDLKISLDGVPPNYVTDADRNLAELGRMLNQVLDRLEKLSFRLKIFEGKKLRKMFRTGVRFPRRMPKLVKYRNEMGDILSNQDFLRDLEAMPVLETLVLGDRSRRSKILHEILQSICDGVKVFCTVRKLVLMEVHDPRLVEGLKTAFPNLERLKVDTFEELDSNGEESGMELGVVLNACLGWERLNYLNLAVPTYPGGMVEALWDSRELYSRLKTLQITTHSEEHVLRHVAEDDMDLFKRLLVAMNEMDDVIISHLYFTPESAEKLVAFLVSNKMSQSKFNMISTDFPYEEDPDD